MAEKKITKKEMFANLIAFIEASNVEEKAEMLTFLAHEIELLEKKASKGNSKKDAENEKLMTEAENALRALGKAVTVTQFMKESDAEVAGLSNQKISAIFKKCVDRGTMIKTVEKKTSYFSVE